MQENPQRSIKAMLCQIRPTYKDKNATIERVQISLDKYSEKDAFDIVIFPEMTFSGYNFKDKADAYPFAVRQNEGIDFHFAKMLAIKLKCYVAFGYIEKVVLKTQEKLYNSAAVINRDGNMIANYRKSHLYYNDKFWAEEGGNFVNFQLITRDDKKLECVLGICMDINPKDFTSGKYELADHILKTKADVLVFLTNWVDSQKNEIHNNDVAATYSYWIHRLTPVVFGQRTLLFLAADRVGTEFDYFAKKQIMFYGSSAAIMINPHKILSNLDVHNEGYLVIQTFLP